MIHRFFVTGAMAVIAVAWGPSSRAQSYLYPILDPTEQQASEGVRRYDASNVVMACSYTSSGSATQGMWWLGSFATGSGATYMVAPQFPRQTVTTSLYYGPNTAFANPTLGSGTIQIVGSYKYAEAAEPNVNLGLLDTGPLNGVGGSWTQVAVPSGITTGTVANTIPHSIMGQVVVGNYDLVGVPGSGNAFLYNTTSGSYTIFNLGGTQNLTSAYGVWQNSADSYTIVGGSQIAGINKAYVIDYTLSTGAFGTPTYFAPRGESVTIFSHFEGISGLPGGRLRADRHDGRFRQQSNRCRLRGGDPQQRRLVFPRRLDRAGRSRIDDDHGQHRDRQSRARRLQVGLDVGRGLLRRHGAGAGGSLAARRTCHPGRFGGGAAMASPPLTRIGCPAPSPPAYGA
jgi:hypothetical protein